MGKKVSLNLLSLEGTAGLYLFVSRFHHFELIRLLQPHMALPNGVLYTRHLIKIDEV